MKVRVLRAFDGYKRGGVFDFPDGLANLLRQRGFVEEAVESAAVEERSEKAAFIQKPRKRRLP
jgi:hypothetical protein